MRPHFCRGLKQKTPGFSDLMLVQFSHGLGGPLFGTGIDGCRSAVVLCLDGQVSKSGRFLPFMLGGPQVSLQAFCHNQTEIMKITYSAARAQGDFFEY